MIASKLVISPETREKLNNPVLSPMKKRQLREQFIIESIRKAVGGTRTKQELIVAAGFSHDATTNSYAAGHTLINSMIKRGLITHNDTKSFKKNWTVLADVKVTPSPKTVAKEVVGTPQSTQVELKEKAPVSAVELVQLAKDFAWENNTDSLRDFIAYAQKTLK